MEQTKKRYSKPSPTRGGYRPGSGRPKGSTNKITMENLLQNLEKHTGIDYAEQIAINYSAAISRNDWAGVRDYDRFLLGKVVADKLEVENKDSEDAVQARAEAFAEALTALTVRTTNKKSE
jgi:hypothetical protein